MFLLSSNGITKLPVHRSETNSIELQLVDLYGEVKSDDISNQLGSLEVELYAWLNKRNSVMYRN